MPEIVVLGLEDDGNRGFPLGKRDIFEGGFKRLVGDYYV